LRKKKPIYGYIDNMGNFVIQPKFYLAEPFDNSTTARVTTLPCYYSGCAQSYLIDREGNKKGAASINSYMVTTTNGEYSKIYHVGIYPFKEESYSHSANYVIDTSGKLYYFSKDEIVALKKNFIICYNEKNNLEALFTIYGLEVLPYTFKTISFERENIVIARGEDEVDYYYYLDPIGKATLLKKRNSPAEKSP